MKLGARLAAIAKFVPVGAKLADIGTDHAYLPVYLAEIDKVSSVIAGEVNVGPYLAACHTVAQSTVADRITVRLGNGLSVLSSGEVDTVVIAGMGGLLICDILDKHLNILADVSTLILQPMVAGATVRHWLVQNDWTIDGEELVEEADRLYEIIVARRGQASLMNDILYDIGPLLWQNKHPLLKKHIEHKINSITLIMMQMRESCTAKNSEKYDNYRNSLCVLEAMKKCL